MRISWLWLSLSFLLPALAAAQDATPRVYVIPAQAIGDENSSLGGIDAAILNAVGDNPILVLTPALAAEGGDLDALATKYKEAAKLVDEDPERAIIALKPILEGYEAAAAQLEDFEPYLQAKASLSAAYFNAGYEDEYVEEAKQIAALRTNWAPKNIPDDVKAEIESAQAKTKKAAPGTLKITASETGFSVRVDGIEQPAGKPISLFPGAHLVVVTAPGKNSYSEKVKISSGATAQVNAALTATSEGPSALEKAPAPPKELIALLKKGTVDGPVRKQISAFGEKQKAQLVVLVLVARDAGKYRANAYAIRVKDSAMVELSAPAYTPAPASALTAPGGDIVGALVKATFDFSKAKAVPPSPALVIAPKGKPVVAGAGSEVAGTRVEPYTIEIAGLVVDSELKAPPDARGSLNVEDAPARYTWFGVMPSGFGGFTGAAYGGGAGGRTVVGGASPTENPGFGGPVDGGTPREPITWDSLKGKWWFWTAAGVVGAGALGAGGYAIFRPRGLETEIVWP